MPPTPSATSRPPISTTSHEPKSPPPSSPDVASWSPAALSVGSADSSPSVGSADASGVADAVGSAAGSWSARRTSLSVALAPALIVRIVLISSFCAPIVIEPGVIGFCAEPVKR
jgi:hypothetical protein